MTRHIAKELGLASATINSFRNRIKENWAKELRRAGAARHSVNLGRHFGKIKSDLRLLVVIAPSYKNESGGR